MSKHHQKANLIVAVQQLLQSQMIGTQEDIRQALQAQGYDVNQVMVSRILHKIGAIKINEGDKVVYRIPSELVSVSPNDSLKQLILSITHNETTIVIQTAPGCAQFIARFLDLKKQLNILGTVAGDDTIFIAPQTIADIENTYQTIYHYLLSY
jgi:transcriptional regulator of arginine metabolism